MKLHSNLGLLALLALAPQAMAQNSMKRIPAPKSVSSAELAGALHVVSEPLFVTDTAEDKALYYDVRDILKGERGPFGATDESELKATREFVKVLRSVMDRRKRGLRSIVAKPKGQILVTGAPMAHEYTRDFLAAQRQAPATLELKMILIEVPAGHLVKLGIEKSSVTMNSEEEYQALLNRFRKSEGITMVTAPEVVLEPRSKAEITTMSQVSYVADYTLHIVEPGGVQILDPVIETVQEGVQIDVRAVPVPGGVVQFDVDVDFSVLQRPIRTVKTRIQSGASKAMEISLPEVDHITLNSVITLPLGSAALISSAAPREGKDFAVILHYAKPRATINPRVQRLFHSMRKGTYSNKWFPELQWADIPALLDLAKSTRELKHFPTNPFSSQAMSVCSEGMVALWLIEGLQEAGNLPSLNPILMDSNTKRSLQDSLPMEVQLKLQANARAAYTSWWDKAQAGRVEGQHALPGTGLSWY